MNENIHLFPESPLMVCVDFGRGSDSTAICVAQMAAEGHLKILSIANQVKAMTAGMFQSIMDRMLRDAARPKGYSQSHWRKIYRQSPLMIPPRIVFDGPLPTSGDSNNG